jgi:hypothetical protein
MSFRTFLNSGKDIVILSWMPEWSDNLHTLVDFLDFIFDLCLYCDESCAQCVSTIVLHIGARETKNMKKLNITCQSFSLRQVFSKSLQAIA